MIKTDAVADVIQLENGDFVVEGDMVFTPEQLVSSNVLKKGSAQSALFRVNNYEWGRMQLLNIILFQQLSFKSCLNEHK